MSEPATDDFFSLVKLAWWAAGATCGVVGGWLTTRPKIANLKAGTVNSAGSFLKDVHAAREKYNRDTIKVGDLVSELMTLIKSNASTADEDAKREELCQAFFSFAIPSFLEHVEYQILERQEEGYPDEIKLVCAFANEELAMFKRWLDTINFPTLLDRLKRTPAKIRTSTFLPLDKTLRRLPPSIRNEQTRIINASIATLVNQQ